MKNSQIVFFFLSKSGNFLVINDFTKTITTNFMYEIKQEI